MAHRLSTIVQTEIDGGWEKNCTNAVVCWVRWANMLNITRPAAVDGDDFQTWLGNPPATWVGPGRNTARFLGKMARDKGSRHTKSLIGLNLKPNKGSLVLWVDDENWFTGHASINGGENTLYGYNQSSFLTGCAHGLEEHCPEGHSTSKIKWDQWEIYTVKPDTAINYFNQNQNTQAYW